MTIRESLHLALTEAMRRRDRPVIAVLRSALSTIANAEAAPDAGGANPSPTGSIHFAGAAHGPGATEVERHPRTEEQLRAIVADEVAQLAAHVERLTSLCRYDEADGARRALEILKATIDRQHELGAAARRPPDVGVPPDRTRAARIR